MTNSFDLFELKNESIWAWLPQNPAKCRENAVRDYGTELVFTFAKVILVRNDPRKFFGPENCTAFYIRPSGTSERAKSLSPKFDGTRNVPLKNARNLGMVFHATKNVRNLRMVFCAILSRRSSLNSPENFWAPIFVSKHRILSLFFYVLPLTMFH